MGLRGVYGTVLELVEAADVVDMGVGRDRDDVAGEQLWKRLSQAGETQAAVDDEVPVAPAEVPDVAAQQRRDEGLVDPRQAIVDADGPEPRRGDAPLHAVIVSRPQMAVFLAKALGLRWAP